MGTFRQIAPGNFNFTGRIVKTQFNTFRVGGENRKVHAFAIVVGTELVRVPRQDFKRFTFRHESLS